MRHAGRAVLVDKEAANKAFEFEAVGSIQGLSNILTETITAAYGGAEKESISSIKFNAVRNYSSQNRAVTAQDYETILLREYPFIESVAVWGGEENDPPQFGRVFISIKPFEGLTLTSQVKEDIAEDVLSKYNIVAVTPEIVDPDFIFIEPSVSVSYDPLKTTKSANEIQADLIALINSFEADYLGKFENNFIHSELVCLLKDSNSAIKSVLIDVGVHKDLKVNVGTVGNYQTSFYNALTAGRVSITGLTLAEDVPVEGATYEIIDDGVGFLHAYRIVNGVSTRLQEAGTVDYETGLITLVQLDIVSVEDEINNTIKVSATTLVEDVDSFTNNILVIQPEDVTVIVESI